MDILGILSLVFGAFGTLSSYWYIGIVPCAVGFVLGIVGMIESYMDSKTSIMGLLLSILGAVASVFFIVSDLDSGALALNAKRFGGEMISSEKGDDFMKFHREGWTPEQATEEVAAESVKDKTASEKRDKITPYWINDDNETGQGGEMVVQSNEPVSIQPEKSRSEENKTDKNNSNRVYKKGETANCNGLELIFLGYTESSGTEYNSPADGKVFVFPEFEIYNGRNEKVTMDTWTPFLYYCDGYNVESSSSAIFSMTELNLELLTGDIVQGGRMKACLPLELPSDWKEMEIFYKDNYYGDTEFSFQFSK